MNLKNKLMIGMSALLIVGSFNVSLAKSFKDLENFDWAKQYIEEYSEKNIVSGYEDGTFKPEKFVTREEFAKIVVNTFNLEINSGDFGFEDVEKDAWYFDYVNTLANLGMVNGIGDNKFGVGTNITREDICTILLRVTEKEENELDEEDKEMSFEDEKAISEYAKKAVSKLYRAGIINGMTEKEMKPKDKTTRAQMVKMVYLLKEKSHSKKDAKTSGDSEEKKTGETSGEKQTSGDTKTVKKERERKVTLNGKEYVLDPNEDYPRGVDGKLVTFTEGKKGVKIKEIYTADELLKRAYKVSKISEELILVQSSMGADNIIDLDIFKDEFDGRVVVLKMSKDKKGNNRVDSADEKKSIDEVKIAKGNKLIMWPYNYEEFDDIDVLFVVK